MKLPKAERCKVDEGKIREYLLNPSHPVGRSKAQFFLGMGFQPDAWQLLANALRQHGLSGGVVSSRETKFGTLYVVEGPLHSVGGSERDIYTVWQLDRGAVAPKLVTAYPRKT